MDWDKPLDITRNSDGTYTKNGNTYNSRPRWTVGSPRLFLALFLQALLHIWMTLDPLATMFSNNVVTVLLLILCCSQYFLFIRSWRNY